jgi:hypothetical protein
VFASFEFFPTCFYNEEPCVVYWNVIELTEFKDQSRQDAPLLAMLKP